MGGAAVPVPPPTGAPDVNPPPAGENGAIVPPGPENPLGSTAKSLLIGGAGGSDPSKPSVDTGATGSIPKLGV
jgi:hypothetical protein